MKLFIKNLLFTLIIPGTVGVYAPLLIVRGRSITSYPVLLLIAIVLLSIGAAIYFWTVWDFAVTGWGTPLPIDAPKTLITRGLYRYIRNPMYVGVLTLILGWACMFTDSCLLIYALGVWIAMHLFVSLYEEPRLGELFGEEYESYKSMVGRWVPHFYEGKDKYNH